MSHERSDKIFHAAWESTEKLDYFVCGVAGAVFAYIIKDFRPTDFTANYAWIEIIALLLLAVSFFVGIKRIETSILIKNANAKKLATGRDAGNLLHSSALLAAQHQFRLRSSPPSA